MGVADHQAAAKRDRAPRSGQWLPANFLACITLALHGTVLSWSCFALVFPTNNLGVFSVFLQVAPALAIGCVFLLIATAASAWHPLLPYPRRPLDTIDIFGSIDELRLTFVCNL